MKNLLPNEILKRVREQRELRNEAENPAETISVVVDPLNVGPYSQKREIQVICEWAKRIGQLASSSIETDVTLLETSYDARTRSLWPFGRKQDSPLPEQEIGKGWKIIADTHNSGGGDLSWNPDLTSHSHEIVDGLALTSLGKLMVFSERGVPQTLTTIHRHIYTDRDGRRQISGLTPITPSQPLPISRALEGGTNAILTHLVNFVDNHNLDLLSGQALPQESAQTAPIYSPRHARG